MVVVVVVVVEAVTAGGSGLALCAAANALCPLVCTISNRVLSASRVVEETCSWPLPTFRPIFARV